MDGPLSLYLEAAVRVSGRTLTKHWFWATVSILILVIGGYYYYQESLRSDGAPSGSSPTGFVLGCIAAGICLFEFLIWPRKILRSWRLLGAAKHWMRAHLWFGAIAFPLALMHSGFRFGGEHNTSLMVVLLLVVVSGVFGLVVQNIVPRLMTNLIPAETIHSQIDHVASQYAQDAGRLVADVCGELPESLADQDDVDTSGERMVVIGAVRNKGALKGRTVSPTQAPRRVANTAEILTAFDKTIFQYLVEGKASGNQLSSPAVTSSFFGQLRQSVNTLSHPVVDELERLCEQRRQFDVQKQMHRWLHGWTTIHIGLSVALMILLISHVVTSLRYW
jgi:hypothetical protein